MTTSTIAAALAVAASLATSAAHAGTFNFAFTGTGVSGNLTLTYGASTDASYPQALELTGISGTFTDTNNGLNIVNAAVGSFVAITHDTPEPTNLLAPHDFSRFPVATGLEHGVLSYDNLLYINGSPQAASDYPFHGGYFDIYGLLFTIGDGRVVNLWSNGVLPGTTGPDYGVALATSREALDYVGGVSAVPEPSSLAFLGLGVLAVAVARRKARA